MSFKNESNWPYAEQKVRKRLALKVYIKKYKRVVIRTIATLF